MNQKISSGFTENDILNWEKSDGVNFAIALSRITGWLLHVDWLTYTDNKEIVENMKSLRVYVGNNFNEIYDFRGKHTIETFTDNIIRPIVLKRGVNCTGVVTRFYSEDTIFNLPLRLKPNEVEIEKAHELINKNLDFISKIPKRKEPNVPAYIAGKYTYGKCNPFANALCDLKYFKPMALIAVKYNEIFDLSKLGYVHSFIIDNDNNAIDIWGKDSIENIALRFGLLEYELNETEHYRVTENLKKNSPKKYKELYDESVEIIKEYFD